MVAFTKKGSRLGVGATASSLAEETISQEGVAGDWVRSGKKQILSVGRKRHRVNDDVTDDDEFGAGIGGGMDYSSEDEDEGRTSAVSERKKIVRRPTTFATVDVEAKSSTHVHDGSTKDDSTSKKKKKKKGRKERIADNLVAGGSANQETNLGMNVDDGIEDGKTQAADTNNKTATEPDNKDKTTNIAGNAEERDMGSSTKRKRKKVRSRQKNIRKDTRAANDKPSHLVLGRSDYAGRPLTKATRQKMKKEQNNPGLIIPSKENEIHHSTNRLADSANAEDSGEIVPQIDVIEGVMVEQKDMDSSRKFSEEQKNTDQLVQNSAKVRQKKKKQKFKNLMVG